MRSHLGHRRFDSFGEGADELALLLGYHDRDRSGRPSPRDRHQSLKAFIELLHCQVDDLG